MVLHWNVRKCLLKDDSSNDLSFAPAAKHNSFFFFFKDLKNMKPCQICQIFVVHPDAVKITVPFFKAVSRFYTYSLVKVSRTYPDSVQSSWVCCQVGSDRKTEGFFFSASLSVIKTASVIICWSLYCPEGANSGVISSPRFHLGKERQRQERWRKEGRWRSVKGRWEEKVGLAHWWPPSAAEEYNKELSWNQNPIANEVGDVWNTELHGSVLISTFSIKYTCPCPVVW